MREHWTIKDGVVTILDDEDSTHATREGKATQRPITQLSKPNYIADDSLTSFCLSQRFAYQNAASQTNPCRSPRSQLLKTHSSTSSLRAREVYQTGIGTASPVTNLQSKGRALRSSAPSSSVSKQCFRSHEKPWADAIDPLVAYSSSSQ